MVDINISHSSLMQYVAGSLCASKRVRYRSVLMCRNRGGGGKGMDSPHLVPSDRDYRKTARG